MRCKAISVALTVWLLHGAVGCGDDGEVATVVRRLELVAVDPTRRTPPNASFPGAPERTIRFLVWSAESAAASSSNRPLLILAHGFGGLPEKFDALARTLARSGATVVAPAFPLTNQNAPGGHETALRDVRNQPGDVSFLLGELTAARETPGHPLYQEFDPKKVLVLGHSLGAVTLLGLTRKACCIDPRIAAAIFVAPPPLLANVFGPDSPEPRTIPTLVVHGEADPVVAVQNGRDLYRLLTPPKAFLGVKGAGHSDLVESQLEPPIPARDAAQQAILAFVRGVFLGATNELTTRLAQLHEQGHEVLVEWR